MRNITITLRTRPVELVKAYIKTLSDIKDKCLLPSEQLVLDDVISIYEEQLPVADRVLISENKWVRR